jgi:hypothetical protein
VPSPKRVQARRPLPFLLDELDSLSSHEQEVLRMRYGLIDGTHFTYSEIGSAIGRSGVGTRQIERSAIARIRRARTPKQAFAFASLSASHPAGNTNHEWRGLLYAHLRRRRSPTFRSISRSHPFLRPNVPPNRVLAWGWSYRRDPWWQWALLWDDRPAGELAAVEFSDRQLRRSLTLAIVSAPTTDWFSHWLKALIPALEQDTENLAALVDALYGALPQGAVYETIEQFEHASI